MRGSFLVFGPFVFDAGSRLLKRDGIELPLPPRVLGVLEVLLRRAGDVVPRQELIDSVWKDAFVTDTSLGEAISLLRQALGDDPQSPSFIQTFHRRGYRFVAPVVAQDPLAADGPSQKVAGTFSEKVPATFRDGGPSIAGQLVPWGIAVTSSVLAAVAIWQAVGRREPVMLPVTRFEVAAAPGTRFDARAPALALSADGARAAWSACDRAGCRLYLRAADRLEAAPIAGTEDAAAPFFSPDGLWIGFFADGHLKKISLSGGGPVTLAEAADVLGAVWTWNHGIVYGGAAAGLRRVRETGGEPTTLTVPHAPSGEVRHMWPSNLTADLLLFTVALSPLEEGGGRLATLRLDAPASPWTTLLPHVDSAAAPSSDVLAFSSGPDLQAVAVDAGRRAIATAPRTVMTGVATAEGAGQFAASSSGALITVAAGTNGLPQLFWRTRATADAVAPHDQGDSAIQSGTLEALAVSPDGRRIVGVSRGDRARPDLWTCEIQRGTTSRLTHEGIAAAPVWSRDGTRVFFASSNQGPFAIYQRDVDSVQLARRLHSRPEHAFPSSVSADGSVLAFVTTDRVTGADVWGLPLTGGAAPQPLIRTPFDDVAAAFSPAGPLIAYQSNDAGRWEVYLHRLSDQRRVTVSTDGGTSPFWAPDGGALFFRSGDRLMRAEVAADGSNVGTPMLWTNVADARPIGIDPDGRVLFQRRPTVAANAAVLTLQWVREVRQLLGPPSPALPR